MAATGPVVGEYQAVPLAVPSTLHFLDIPTPLIQIPVKASQSRAQSCSVEAVPKTPVDVPSVTRRSRKVTRRIPASRCDSIASGRPISS